MDKCDFITAPSSSNDGDLNYCDEPKVPPMAFTIDFGCSNPATSSKKGTFGIRDSISKFAPSRATSYHHRKKKSHNQEAKDHSQEVQETGDNNTREDALSETGTYTLDEDDKDGGGSSSLEWVREWAEKATDQMERHQSEEGELWMKETQQLMLSLEESVNSAGRKNVASTNNSLNNSPYKRSNVQPESRIPSRRMEAGSSSSANLKQNNKQPRNYSNVSAASLRARPTSSAGQEKGRNGRTTSPFARNDGGRFSLRARASVSPSPSPAVNCTNSKGSSIQKTSPNKMTNGPVSLPVFTDTNKKSPAKKQPAILLAQGKRANSSLTAKEVELANWNRRKSYDPMRSAALGRRKGTKSPTPIDQPEPDKRFNPEAAATLPRSGFVESPIGDSSISSTEDYYGRTNSLGRNSGRGASHYENDELSSPTSPNFFIGNRNASSRYKLDPLDTLVISTVHSLSNKCRSLSRQLLEKLLMTQPDDDENGALMGEMIEKLKELEMQSTNSHNKGTSRELSDTLKNLKKIEQVILVLDRLFFQEC